MALKVCLARTCPNPATYRGRCATHARERERVTHPNRKVYGTKRWQVARRHQLRHHPLCADCGRIATDVHHVVAIEDGGSVWAGSNHQSLCTSCHSKVTRREQGEPPK